MKSLPEIIAEPEKERDCWETPPELFRVLDKIFKFTVDVCASSGSAKCKRFHSRLDDGLSKSWAGETAWCNPPYSNIGPWMEKAAKESIGGACTAVLLVPPWTDTRYWSAWASSAAHMILLPGRVNFLLNGKPGAGNKTPSCLLVYGRPTWWHPWDKGPGMPRLSAFDWRNIPA